MTELKRITKAGFINFKRGGSVSMVAVIVVIITLSVITAIILLQAVFLFSLNVIRDKVDVRIYITKNTPEDKIMFLKSSLEKLPEVAEVSYMSAEDNLADFRLRHASDYPTIAALDELNDNPLLATFGVKAREISQYETIANFLKSNNASLMVGSVSVVDHTNYYNNKLVMDRLNTIISGAQRLGFLITVILIIISIIVTFNTIKLTIFIAKEEIGVMRLVGASKMYVRGPFMIEGVIYGIVATIVTLILFLPITIWLGRNMTDFLGLNIYNYYISNFFQIFAIILLSGIILGGISSFLAVRKYLNK